MNKITCSLLLMCLLLACKEAEKEHSHDDGVTTHSDSENNPAGAKDTLEAKRIEQTEYSPAYIQHATGIEIIPDLKTAVTSNGVLTHEGIFGPLLFGEKIRSFFIELQPGMFLSEHPHPTESMVYTVSGRWVLCSEGKRQLMEPGSVFHFGSDIPTGWEAPFNEKALLYIVKTKIDGESYEPFTKGLLDMAKTLNEEKANGTVFYFNALHPDHPAVLFGRKINPEFDMMLANIKNK